MPNNVTHSQQDTYAIEKPSPLSNYFTTASNYLTAPEAITG